jgi:hypothetical protein
MSIKTYNLQDLEKRYEDMTICIQATCHLTTSLVGGQPSTRKSIEAFVRHQLKLEGEEAAEAVNRILQHEIEAGVKAVQIPDDAELSEVETKSVNLIRRDDHGPWLGDWMIKANLKNAFTRCHVFVDTKGTKGDAAEAGRARALGTSLLQRPGMYNDNRVYLRNPAGDGPANTYLEFFKGKVSTPLGMKSIVTVAEVCEPGAQFSFEFRMYNGNVSDHDLVNVCAMAMIVGLGSARSFERGKFAIDYLTVERGEKKEKAKSAKSLKEKIDDALPTAEAIYEKQEEEALSTQAG